MASRPDGDVWNIVDNDKDSQHYGRNFKFDFSYISSEEIKDVVKDYVWQNYRVGNKSLYTLYHEVHTNFFQFIRFADTRNITSLKGLTNTDVVLLEEEMKELIKILNKASELYYQKSTSICHIFLYREVFLVPINTKTIHIV